MKVFPKWTREKLCSVLGTFKKVTNYYSETSIWQTPSRLKNSVRYKEASHFSESSKLCALRAQVPTCFVYLRAQVPTCLACFRAHMQTWFTCLRAHVPTCLTCWCVNVPCVLTCSRALRAYVLKCQCALRA